MKTTPNLGLKKPDQEDFYNVDDFNYNADILDKEVTKRIINAGGVPSIQAGLDAEKPTPGTAGRLYVATDTQMIYRDTGTAWQKVGAVKWDDIEGKPDLALASDLAAHLAETASINAIGHVYAAEFTAILSTSWSGSAPPYTQTVTINGITSAHNPIIDVVMSGTYSTDQQRIEQWGYIYRAVTGTNSITFYAHEKPTISLPIRVKVVA